MVSGRKKQLLKLVIESYIKTSEPVGSKFLVSKKKLDVSDATVRNEMRDLENAGYLTHPHTSAGRIPTEEGYIFYVESLMSSRKLSPKTEEELRDSFEKELDRRVAVKMVAKYVAEQIDAAVIVAFSQNSVYYTGIAHLFSQPEFRDIAHTVNISSVFDHCEDHLQEVSDHVSGSTATVLIGSSNPLGKQCSFVAAKTKEGELLGILGPMRMNYKSAIPFINYIQEHI
ncbi:MAG: hypothetical protein ABII02_01000 [Candidatus Magasanikbacteria bacterium]